MAQGVVGSYDKFLRLRLQLFSHDYFPISDYNSFAQLLLCLQLIPSSALTARSHDKSPPRLRPGCSFARVVSASDQATRSHE